MLKNTINLVTGYGDIIGGVKQPSEKNRVTRFDQNGHVVDQGRFKTLLEGRAFAAELAAQYGLEVVETESNAISA
jgi:hypothetical protein